MRAIDAMDDLLPTCAHGTTISAVPATSNARYEEMADLTLGFDPGGEPERARNAARSHLDRANWMVTTGYRETVTQPRAVPGV
ncbi:hypothetical protein AU467_18435 [Mesorhizobium loti]|uniref:Uncharacterized protein n=1 Tax=Rhizobium loti TaxID=381 RepID=A0A101KU41_RHILI|nr:hypothetical protein AU467_18435 [Mesorhizobium loti]